MRGFHKYSVKSRCFARVSSLDAVVDYYGMWSRHKGSEMGISIKPASSIKDVCSPYRSSINSFNHYHLDTFFLLFVFLLAIEQSDFLGGGKLLMLPFCRDDHFVCFILFCKGFIKTVYLMLVTCWFDSDQFLYTAHFVTSRAYIRKHPVDLWAKRGQDWLFHFTSVRVLLITVACRGPV